MIINIILKTVFKSAMSLLFGSIIMIQILAHLPLADIVLPANALQQFEIMIGIVSFDFFSPTDYIDLGFTDMPFWSENFDWLGYSSINFIELMGSLLVFSFYYVLIGLIVLACSFAAIRSIKNKWLLNYLSCKSYMSHGLGFLHGTFFEILVSVSCSMAMLKYSAYLNPADWVSIALSFLFCTILLSQIIFVGYFTIFRTKEWTKKAIGENHKLLS